MSEKTKETWESKAFEALREGRTIRFAGCEAITSKMKWVGPARLFMSGEFISKLPPSMIRIVPNLRTSANPEVVFRPYMMLSEERHNLMLNIKCLNMVQVHYRAAIMAQGREVAAMYIAGVGNRRVSTFFPKFLMRRIASFLGLQISDLTKTGFGCLSDRKKHMGKTKTKRKKEPYDL